MCVCMQWKTNRFDFITPEIHLAPIALQHDTNNLISSN